MPFWTLKKSKIKYEIRTLKKSKVKYEKKEASEDNAVNKMSANSEHTQYTHIVSVTDSSQKQSTHNACVTDTLKYEDTIQHQDITLVQKDDEIIRLRQHINEYQEQLSMLHKVVKQVEVDVELVKLNKKRGNRNNYKMKRTTASFSGDHDEISSVSVEDEEEEEWSQELGESTREDKTVSSLHAHVGESLQPLQQYSGHSRHSIHKNSIRSRRSMRRDSYHSLRNSISSRSGHSIQRDSIRSRQSFRVGSDDGIPVISQKSLQSASLTIKSLPREIELAGDEEHDDDNQDSDDDCSFYDDSCETQEKYSRSVGSPSRNSRASQRSISRSSIVSGGRSKSRNSC